MGRYIVETPFILYKKLKCMSTKTVVALSMEIENHPSTNYPYTCRELV